MVKTDAHMKEVKGRLLVEKRKMEEAKGRRKAREAKRIAKEVQAQKLKERAKQKKEEIESIKKWSKQRQQSGFVGAWGRQSWRHGLVLYKVFERSNKKGLGVAPGDKSGGKAGHGGGKGKKGGDKKKNKEYRNSSFGFRGMKGLKKQNTVETTNDLRCFNKGNILGNKKERVIKRLPKKTGNG